MGLLNRFFKSQEELARDVSLKNEDFLRAWNDYHKTVNEKSVLIEFLSKDNYLQTVPKLQKLLALELSDIEGEEKTYGVLLGDLRSIEHYKRIQRVQRLSDRLAFAESKYKYIYKLLHELHNSIISQLHIIEKLKLALSESKGAVPDSEYKRLADIYGESFLLANLITQLKSQSAVEREVMKQIESRETFHGLFLALAKGEQIIGRMDAKEKQLLKRLEVVMQSVLSNKRKKGQTYLWADKVIKGLEDQVREYVARHEEQDEVGFHEFIGFEYVNHPEFFDFVRKCAAEVGEKPSEQIVNVFVHTFREFYNNADSHVLKMV